LAGAGEDAKGFEAGGRRAAQAGERRGGNHGGASPPRRRAAVKRLDLDGVRGDGMRKHGKMRDSAFFGSSNAHPLDRLERDLSIPSIVRLRRARTGEVRHPSGLLERLAVLKIKGHARGAKRVIADALRFRPFSRRSPRSMRFADADQAVALGGRAALLLETAPLLRS
jgi:hypothetical protein